jgi:hypothetical protein
MLQALRAKWSTALALLIAVATAWMFAASRPTSPPPGSEGEIVCAREIPETPGISKQQSTSDQGTPRGDKALEATYACGIPFAQILALGDTPSGGWLVAPRSLPAGSGYPRGPPANA